MSYLLNGSEFDESIWDRFWSKVDMRGLGDCWEWKAYKDKDGHGLFWDGKGTKRAARIAFLLAKDDIPKRLLICHDCDNPSCCNPFHMFLGTRWCNTHDMIGKGRWRNSNVLTDSNSTTAC